MLALLVDGMNLVRRIYAAVPGEEGTAAHRDDVLRSCTRSLGRALDEHAPTHALCVFDAPAPTWRHALFPGYKADRPPTPAPLVALMPELVAAFADLGVRSVSVDGFEADDVLATVTARVVEHGGRVLVLSTDKSMLTLLGAGVRVRNHFDERDLDAEWVRGKFGVEPALLTTWLALAGDGPHTIPGVRSIGAKTATKLIGEHGALEAILAAADEIPGRPGRALREGADAARLSMRLATLRTDVEVGVNLRECRVPPPGAAT